MAPSGATASPQDQIKFTNVPAQGILINWSITNPATVISGKTQQTPATGAADGTNYSIAQPNTTNINTGPRLPNSGEYQTSISVDGPGFIPGESPPKKYDYALVQYDVSCEPAPVQPGTITIQKVKDQTSDSGADDPNFSFTVDGNSAGTLKVGNSSSPIQVTAGVAHSVAEVTPLPENWTLTSATCDGNQSPASVTVASGQNVTCTFTNKYTAPPPGTITIQKVKDQASDSGADDPDFNFNIDGNSAATLKVGNSSSPIQVTPGQHSVAEVTPLPANWSLTSVSCGDNQNPASVTVASGQNVTCTFINKYTAPAPGTITIQKVKDPTSDPGADDPDFDFNIDGNSAATLKVGNSSNPIDVTPGVAHNVAEVTPLPANWTLTSATCDGDQDPASVTVASGENVTCTFTNKFTGSSQNQGTITIRKVLDQTSDPNPDDPDFNFNVDNSLAATLKVGGEAQIPVVPGQHSVEEVGPLPTNWSLTGIDCGDNQNPASVDVGSNENVICTFTNKFTGASQTQGTIIIQKALDPNSDAGADDPDFNFNVDGASAATLKVGQQAVIPVVPGQHTVNELAPPSNWALTSVSCGNQQNPATVTVAADQTVTCIFTNRFSESGTGTILLRKIKSANSDPGADDPFFNFDIDNLGAKLKAGQQKQIQVVAGQHSVRELTPPENWSLSGVNCGNNQNPATVIVAADETVTCSFTNTYDPPAGKLTIKKVAIGGDDNFRFSLTGQPSFALRNGQDRVFSALPAGQYTIRETDLPKGWTVQNISCSENGTKQGNAISISVDDGDKIVCTFTNFKEKDDTMKDVTNLFVHRRVDNLLTYGPDRARFLRRLEKPTSPGAGNTSSGFSDASASSAPMSYENLIPGGNAGLPPSGISYGVAPALAGIPEDPGISTFGSETVAPRQSLFSSFGVQMLPLAAGESSFKFSTSLSEMRATAAAAAAEEQQQKLKAAGLSYQEQPYNYEYAAIQQGFDVWVEGHMMHYNDGLGGISRDGDFGVLYAGVDYVLQPGVLIGALVQVDDTEEDIDDPAVNGEIDGTGWMAGPYIGVRLSDFLFFDARGAWGTSNNDIWLSDGAAGRRTADFDTDRWLATASLTGNQYYGPWRLSPQLSIAYGNETYDTFRNSLAQIVSGSDATIGRLSGAFEVGYQFQTPSGVTIEPEVAITGIWNFDTDDIPVGGLLYDASQDRGKVDGGFIVRTPSGWALRAAGTYDGIGADDFEAYGGSVWLSVPLN